LFKHLPDVKNNISVRSVPKTLQSETIILDAGLIEKSAIFPNSFLSGVDLAAANAAQGD
jgi:hypothetical protein